MKQSVLPNRREANINSLSDLKDQTIGLQTGTVAETWASKNESKIQEKEFTKYETMAECFDGIWKPAEQ